MSRCLALAVLPALALLAGAAQASPIVEAAQPTIDRTATAGRLGAARHYILGSADFSLDGSAFVARGHGAGLADALAPTDAATRGKAGQAATRHPAEAKPSSIARLPEPATWAMMILGFGLIGGAVRRGLRRSDQRFNDYIRSITDNPEG